jgi:hypothetical protein
VNAEHLKAAATLLLAGAAMVGAVDIRDISRAADMASRNHQLLSDMFNEIHTKSAVGVEIASNNQRALERVEMAIATCRGKK